MDGARTVSGDTALRWAVYAGVLAFIVWAVAVGALTVGAVVRMFTRPPLRSRVGDAQQCERPRRGRDQAAGARTRGCQVSPGATADPGDGRGGARGLSSTSAPPRP